MQVFFTSDLHIGHKNIFKYRDIFNSAEEHHEYMISKIESMTKRQMVVILGDFLFDCDEYNEYLKRILNAKCKIKLLLGNHDSKKLYNSGLDIQLPFYSYKNMWVSHAPVHPDELRNRVGNIHGHLHKEFIMKDAINLKYGLFPENTRIKDDRYFNVNIDVNNYEFVPLDTIKQHFNLKGN